MSGCGNGAVDYTVADKTGASILAIDMDEENIAVAKQKYAHPNIQFVVGDALKELPDSQYDVVILSNVLEHFSNRPEFLRKVREQISPNRILIRVPSFERDWRVPLKREIGVEWRLDTDHKTEYTVEGFVDEMKTSGLRVDYREMRWGEIWAEVVPESEPGSD